MKYCRPNVLICSGTLPHPIWKVYFCWRHNKGNFCFQTNWRYFNYQSCWGSHLSSLHSGVNFTNAYFSISSRHWCFSFHFLCSGNKRNNQSAFFFLILFFFNCYFIFPSVRLVLSLWKWESEYMSQSQIPQLDCI